MPLSLQAGYGLCKSPPLPTVLGRALRAEAGGAGPGRVGIGKDDRNIQEPDPRPGNLVA